MENKDRLDEFLQHKFAEDNPEQRFAFREEYWQQAQMLIEADERRKRRRGLFWWWTAGGFGLALIAVWWMTGGTGHFGHPFRAGTAATPETSSPVEKLERGDKIQRISGYSNEPAPNMPSRQERMQSNHLQGVNLPQNGRPNRPQYRGAGSSPVEAGPSGLLAVGKISNDLAAGANLNDPALSPEGQDEVQSSKLLLYPLHLNEPATSAEVQDGAAQTLTNKKDGDTPETRGNAPQKPMPQVPPDLLPTRLQPLKRQPLLPDMLPAPKPPVAEVKPRDKWRWQLGALVSVSSTNGYLNQKDFGLGLGLSTRLTLWDSPFSLNADLQWRSRQAQVLDTIFIGNTAQSRYSFGYVRDIQERRATVTRWLEIPVYLQYSRKQFGAEIGVMPVRLLALRGREDQYRQTSLEPEKVFVGSKNIKLTNRYFETSDLSLFAGIECRPTSRLGLGLRVHYQPNRPWRGDEYADAPKSPVWLDLRTRFFIVQKKNNQHPR